MNGPLLAMHSAVDTSTLFPRSRSSSDIPDLLNASSAPPPPSTPHAEEIPRAASFTSIPALASPEYSNEKQLYRVASAAPSPTFVKDNDSGNSNSNGQGTKRLTKEVRPKLERLGRRKSLVARPKSWIQRVKGSPERRESPEPLSTTPADAPPVPTISRPPRDKTKTVSGSFATFARKSWMSSSRSPSPKRNTGNEVERDGEIGAPPKMTASKASSPSRRRSTVGGANLEIPSPANLANSPPIPSRTTSTLQKLRQRPQSVLMNVTFNTANSSTSSLPRSSLDNRSTPRTSTDKVPPLPSSERLQSLVIEAPRRRDELGPAFRSLDHDFSKFQSKTWSLKTNVVRASLLPFLRNHASHPSNKNLQAEDLDRRVSILNKWWCGLLEVLDGRQNQTVSGVDRPVLLDAAVAIMMRPEWRTAPPPITPLSERSPNSSPERPALLKKTSASSLNSSTSRFLSESVYHSTRILFIQNLIYQLKYVVEKMSLRHAPASLVTFCGKAIAYAFFFVPDVAEVLVRIWKLQPASIQRVADELGVPRRPNKADMDEVITAFPSHTQSLGWTSVKSMANYLRQTPVLAPAIGKIPWHGPWVARWCGRDSDVFFVFVKHYHILADEFMPAGLSLAAKARSPGFLLVQTQVLGVLNGTIHRQPATTGPPPVSFDDVLSGADASAAALPLPSTNSARLMSENRLIMLLRDFMSERPSDYDSARLTFAECFAKIMQAAACRTSIFDHNACFVLCDFMEEALVIYVRFHLAHSLETDFIDWHFWLDVCKKMLESENTMSQIRLFAFLYGTWSVVTDYELRKEFMCIHWLLEVDTFDKFFNHWCPMVRAYYMRLLCWRICREDGEATDVDTKIFYTVLTLLKANWAKFLFLKHAAEKSRILPPSAVPCHPAPGRRLVIMRNDNQATAANLLVGFDGIMAPGETTNTPTPSRRLSSLVTLSKLDTADSSNPKLTTDSPTTPNKKRWTFMGKMLPSTFAITTDGTSSSPTRGASPTKTLEEARRETAIARSRPGLRARSSSSGGETSTIASYRVLSFKFSLEWSQHFERIEGNAKFNRLGWRLIPPRLPGPAQSFIGAKMPGLSREVEAKDPAKQGEKSVARAKYAGRALAEWAQIVGEYNGFVDRRRSEGVPSLKLIETPTLSVEGFRRFG